jgi:hypothetical protein
LWPPRAVQLIGERPPILSRAADRQIIVLAVVSVIGIALPWCSSRWLCAITTALDENLAVPLALAGRSPDHGARGPADTMRGGEMFKCVEAHARDAQRSASLEQLAPERRSNLAVD